MIDKLKSLFNFGDSPKEETPKTAEQIKLTGDIARNCLSLPAFQTYRKAYAELEEAVIGDMIKEAATFSVDQTDISKFGARCLVKLTRLRDLRSLLTKVEADAKRGTDEAKRLTN